MGYGMDELADFPGDPDDWMDVPVHKMPEDVNVSIDHYNDNKSAKVGDKIICPTCRKTFNKRSYNNIFCGTRGPGKKSGKATLCKDQFWNRLRYWGKEV